MYIKFKDGTVLEGDSLHLNHHTGDISWYGSKGDLNRYPLSEIAVLSDKRPELIERDQVEYIMIPYLAWSELHENKKEERETIEGIHDLMDYLCWTKQSLTPSGFVPLSELEAVKPCKKVQVVYSHLLRDGGTTVYKDQKGIEYYVLARHYRLGGVYKGILTPGLNEERTWDDLRMWDVELEIVEQLPAPAPAPMLHRDDRPGC